VVVIVVVDVVVVVGIANASLARCIQSPVLIVVMKLRYHSSQETIGLYIAAIVTNHSRRVQIAIVAADLAGSLNEPDQSKPGRFVRGGTQAF
jgi:hypothetical protein